MGRPGLKSPQVHFPVFAEFDEELDPPDPPLGPPPPWLSLGAAAGALCCGADPGAL
jgi:hypothetical protein